MGGFLSLYDETARVDLGGGYYVDIKRYLSDAEYARAENALVSKRIESMVAAKRGTNDGEVRSVATIVDQRSHDLELLVAHIVGWNLTDQHGEPLPLPPYIQPKRSDGDDPANQVRRDSIGRLPTFAKKRILAQIRAFEELGADELAAFPDGGDSAPAQA